MSVLVVLALVLLALLVLAVVVGWVDSRRRRRPRAPEPYVERETHLF